MDGTPPTLQSVLDSCRAMVEAGAALHWLVPREKRPILNAWSTAPVLDLAGLKATYRHGANIGVRLGEPSCIDGQYLHLIDLDIRNPQDAPTVWGKLLALWPGTRAYPTVISGSGGESRHIYFLASKPLRKMTLAKGAEWEIVLMGTGSQAVIPPSIHPLTGKAYVWTAELPIDMPFLMEVSDELIAGWGASESNTANNADLDDDDDLLGEIRKKPMDLTEEQVDDVLANIPNDGLGVHYDDYVQVGMALNHQYQGSDFGFKKWCKWASQSSQFKLSNAKGRWKSFSENKRSVVRMATLIQIANDHKVKSNLPAVVSQDDSDLDDLLGGPVVATGAAQAVQKAPVIDPNWSSYLARNAEGHPTSCLHNAKLALEYDPRSHGILAMNEFKQQYVLIRPPKRATQKEGKKPVVQLEGSVWEVKDPVNGTSFGKAHENQIRLMLEAPKSQGGYSFGLSDRDLRAAIDIVANKNCYHPVRNYLRFVIWDGIPRVERMFIDYLGCDDNAYYRECSTMTLVGAVSRAMEPGHKFDYVPILEGVQGKRKSTFINILGRSWSSELSGDFGDAKVLVEQILGSWIVEIPELQGFNRADINDLKAMVSRQVDRARMAYGYYTGDYPRQCIFMGSTNDKEYLRDHTGGRRFWPIECNIAGDINTEKLEAEIDQIWAEAYQIYLSMRRACKLTNLPLFLKSPEAKAIAEELQESRRIETAEDTTLSDIQAWLDTPLGPDDPLDDLDPNAEPVLRNYVCASMIWQEMMGRDPATMGSADATRIGKALVRLEGWHRVGRFRTRKYGQQRIWARDGFTSWTIDEIQ